LIKAVFFDWFNTLALYHPPREELQAAACREHGIEVEPQQLTRSLFLADKYFWEENARSSISKRSSEEQKDVHTEYEIRLLKEVGIEATRDVAALVMSKTMASLADMSFVLYGDVLPTIDALKQRGLVIGLISNIERDILPICQELGLAPYLDVIVTPVEAGADKPDPAIFHAALKNAMVKASEAIHVGDQYSSDVVGARGAGITPLLIDRHNIYDKDIDCPRIKSLNEIETYL